MKKSKVIPANKMKIEEKAYELSTVLAEVIQEAENQTGIEGLEFYTEIDKQLPSQLCGDKGWIGGIWKSLFEAAVKETKSGYIFLSAQGEWTENGEFRLKLSVADTGEGIREEKLAEVKLAVEQMQGDIRVQSAYQSGSLLTVRIPQKILNPEPLNQEIFNKKPLEQEAEDRHSRIDKSIGLVYCGESEEMYQEMLGFYLLEGEKHIRSLVKYYGDKDWKNYAVTVHAVKSTSMTIGAKELSNLAKELEMAARGADGEFLKEHQQDFLGDYKAVLEEIKASEGVIGGDRADENEKTE